MALSAVVARANLVARLRARRSEIEDAIFARILDDVSDPAGDQDAEYLAGLRTAVAATVGYGLMGIEHGEGWSEPIPSAVVVQAHRAVRSGVTLDRVLRRYAVGHTLLGDFVMDEADRFPSQVLRHVLRAQGSLLDRLMALIASEYEQEVEQAGRSREQRLTRRIQRLLDGENVKVDDLNYQFDAWHLGMIVTGAEAGKAVWGLATRLDRKILSLPCCEGTLWAWLGGQRRLAFTDIKRLLFTKELAGVSLAIGEPGKGIEGWRLTHRQAQAASLVALRDPQRLTPYAGSMLVAAALQNDTLAKSLKEIHLSPLGNKKEGARSRDTLHAYFGAGCNAATAAARLKVDRHTVERRLDKIQEKLGRPLYTCHAEMEVALRLEALGDPSVATIHLPGSD